MDTKRLSEILGLGPVLRAESADPSLVAGLGATDALAGLLSLTSTCARESADSQGVLNFANTRRKEGIPRVELSRPEAQVEQTGSIIITGPWVGDAWRMFSV